MEVTSPPKRMTRARAAAKDAAAVSAPASAAAPASSAATTAASRAKAAATSSTKPTSTRPSSRAAAPSAATRTAKRKARCDDHDELDDDDEDELAASSTDFDAPKTMIKPPARGRGRPKKIAEPEPESEAESALQDAAAAKPTRGRPRKTAVPAAEPVKATRTRTTRKAAVSSSADAASGDVSESEPAKKPTRKRATSSAKDAKVTMDVTTNPTPGLKSAVSRSASRSGAGTKKTVTFQEPEKENTLPSAAAAAAKPKAKAADTAPTGTGMRGRPVRKPATGARTTRAAAAKSGSAADEVKEKTPLSPKKDGVNRSLSRDDGSDDELATLEKTPFKPLMKSPVKPPAPKRADVLPPGSDLEDESQRPAHAPASSALASPARRPPSTPWKDASKSPTRKVEAVPSLASPAKRADAVPSSLALPSSKKNTQAAESTAKASILQSPAKRPQMPIKSLQAPQLDQSADVFKSPAKRSLFQSPAKRPASPTKMLDSMKAAEEHHEPLLANKPEQMLVAGAEQSSQSQHEDPFVDSSSQLSATVTAQEPTEVSHYASDEITLESPKQLVFPGRLSAVLPRHADPALKDNPLPGREPLAEQAEAPVAPSPQQQVAEETAPVSSEFEDQMEVDGLEVATETTPPQSPPKQAIRPAFTLSSRNFGDNSVSDSEDELASSASRIESRFFNEDDSAADQCPATPTPLASRTPRSGMASLRSGSKGTKLGFTPLAAQLSSWKASSPTKAGRPETPTQAEQDEFSLLEGSISSSMGIPPSKSEVLDHPMETHCASEVDLEQLLEADIDAVFEQPVFDDEIGVTNEDVELAAEANEMSLLDSAQLDEMMDAPADMDFIADMDEQYGDENAIPIDPALLASLPATPVRPGGMREVHTVSKVPLKGGDETPPHSMKKRSFSASKAASQRPSAGLTRNATVISYSPTKNHSGMDLDAEMDAPQEPTTLSKTDMWSSMGTPARTPRRDLNTSLLRGAVVFVDVHTSEGADASTLFVELLTQMGARCVKTWSWNPSGDAKGDHSSSKIGITHVVYKDGGKRTMEKVRESNGVVQCVGVGWVLDCERENEWLEEGPYYIDTSLIPRGGKNRRKSMEPKAIANMNGTLVTPMKNNAQASRDCQSVPNNHVSRRDSTLWMRTPSDRDDDEGLAGEDDWDCDMGSLTPFPMTPAPETVAKFAMDITPQTPTADIGELSGGSLDKDQLLMRTCPPKQSAATDLGRGVLRDDKDQTVMMRLMAARRKSMQFAPKIGSPLAKAWK